MKKLIAYFLKQSRRFFLCAKNTLDFECFLLILKVLMEVCMKNAKFVKFLDLSP